MPELLHIEAANLLMSRRSDVCDPCVIGFDEASNPVSRTTSYTLGLDLIVFTVLLQLVTA